MENRRYPRRSGAGCSPAQRRDGRSEGTGAAGDPFRISWGDIQRWRTRRDAARKSEGLMPPRITLAEIFRAAGKAHHRAFAATKGDDPRWPEWYARDLAPMLSS